MSNSTVDDASAAPQELMADVTSVSDAVDAASDSSLTSISDDKLDLTELPSVCLRGTNTRKRISGENPLNDNSLITSTSGGLLASGSTAVKRPKRSGAGSFMTQAHATMGRRMISTPHGRGAPSSSVVVETRPVVQTSGGQRSRALAKDALPMAGRVVTAESTVESPRAIAIATVAALNAAQNDESPRRIATSSAVVTASIDDDVYTLMGLVLTKDAAGAIRLLQKKPGLKLPIGTDPVPYIVTTAYLANTKDKDGKLWNWMLRQDHVVFEEHMLNAAQYIRGCASALNLWGASSLFAEAYEAAVSLQTSETSSYSHRALEEVRTWCDTSRWKSLQTCLKTHKHVLKVQANLDIMFEMMCARNGSIFIRCWHNHVIRLTPLNVIGWFSKAVTRHALHTANALRDISLVSEEDIKATLTTLDKSTHRVLVSFLHHQLATLTRSTSTTTAPVHRHLQQ